MGVVAALGATAFVLRYAPWAPKAGAGHQREILTLPAVTVVLSDSGAPSVAVPKANRKGKRHALGDSAPTRDSVRVQIGAILRVPTMGIAPVPIPPPESLRTRPDPARLARRTAFGTPTVIPPRITNRAEAVRLLRQTYPEELRAAQVAGVTVLRMRISDDGHVEERYVTVTSGNMLLDQAALSAMKSLQFTPARYAGQAVGADVEIPVVFRVRPGS